MIANVKTTIQSLKNLITIAVKNPNAIAEELARKQIKERWSVLEADLRSQFNDIVVRATNERLGSRWGDMQDSVYEQIEKQANDQLSALRTNIVQQIEEKINEAITKCVQAELATTKIDLKNQILQEIKHLPLPETIEPQVWKTIIGCEGFYEVSSYGLVRSLDRVVEVTLRSGKIQKRNYTGKVLTQMPDKQTGQKPTVGLSVDGEKTICEVAVLVSRAFLEQPPKGVASRLVYKDGNYLNCSVKNLEIICTYD